MGVIRVVGSIENIENNKYLRIPSFLGEKKRCGVIRCIEEIQAAVFYKPKHIADYVPTGFPGLGPVGAFRRDADEDPLWSPRILDIFHVWKFREVTGATWVEV